jgi:hypothetical protein
VRLKITKPLRGSIDGLHVGRFAVGEVYEVGTALANYLLAVGAAEPVVERLIEVSPEKSPAAGDGLRRRLSGGDARLLARAAERKRRPTKRR